MNTSTAASPARYTKPLEHPVLRIVNSILYFILLLVSSSAISLNAFSSNNRFVCNSTLDTTAYPKAAFQEINWGKYFGKPITYLLNKLEKKLPGYILSDVNPGHRFRAQSIHVYYANKIVIILRVYNFKYLDPSHKAYKWDKSLFCRENIEGLEVWSDSTCLYSKGVE